MPQTWKTGEGEDYKCDHCGSIYAVQIWRSPAREVVTAKCEVCGEEMYRKNTTDSPTFTLKAKGDGQPI